MNRPYLNALAITSPINAKSIITVTVTAEDKEIIFGTDYKYARASEYEAYAGEDGII